MTELTPVSFSKRREPAPRLSEKYIPGRRSARFWTEAEKEVLRAHYPTGGAIACQPHLPHRRVGQIYRQAQALGLRVDGEAVPRKRREPVATPAGIDMMLRAAWPDLRGRGAVQVLADQLGVPRWWITKRATALGLTMPHRKEPAWSAAEDDLMRRMPLHDPGKAAEIFRDHGFARSPTAIVMRAKRLDLSRRKLDTFSASRAAALLGLDGKTVTNWCILGDIAATRRGTARLPQQGGDQWEIEPAELRRFIVEKLERIDIRKVDKFAFVALLVDAEAAAVEAAP